jgi:hypothetical protein
MYLSCSPPFSCLSSISWFLSYEEVYLSSYKNSIQLSINHVRDS